MSGWLLHGSPRAAPSICSAPLVSMQSGAWTRHGADEVCRAPQPSLRVLCSSNASDVHGTRGHGLPAKSMVWDTRPAGMLWRPKNCTMVHYSATEACGVLRAIGGLALMVTIGRTAAAGYACAVWLLQKQATPNSTPASE